MATARELALNIGKRGLLRVSGTGLTFEVEILDARNRYGNMDYKVRPISGEGETWHEATGIDLTFASKCNTVTHNNNKGDK
jgi:hypothetical protein